MQKPAASIRQHLRVRRHTPSHALARHYLTTAGDYLKESTMIRNIQSLPLPQRLIQTAQAELSASSDLAAPAAIAKRLQRVTSHRDDALVAARAPHESGAMRRNVQMFFERGSDGRPRVALRPFVNRWRAPLKVNTLPTLRGTSARGKTAVATLGHAASSDAASVESSEAQSVYSLEGMQARAQSARAFFRQLSQA